MKPWQVLTALALVGLIALFASGIGRDPRYIPPALLGQAAPLFEGTTLAGETFRLKDHRGKVVLINFWATWCQGCKEEHPLLLEIARRFGSRQDFLMVGIDYKDDPEQARAYLRRYGGDTYPHVMDPHGRIAIDYGQYGVPETYLLDREGRIVHKVAGPLKQEFVERVLVPVLESQQRSHSPSPSSPPVEGGERPLSPGGRGPGLP